MHEPDDSRVTGKLSFFVQHNVLEIGYTVGAVFFGDINFAKMPLTKQICSVPLSVHTHTHRWDNVNTMASYSPQSGVNRSQTSALYVYCALLCVYSHISRPACINLLSDKIFAKALVLAKSLSCKRNRIYSMGCTVFSTSDSLMYRAKSCPQINANAPSSSKSLSMHHVLLLVQFCVCEAACRPVTSNFPSPCNQQQPM